jgi:hypothetical protein
MAMRCTMPALRRVRVGAIRDVRSTVAPQPQPPQIATGRGATTSTFAGGGNAALRLPDGHPVRAAQRPTLDSASSSGPTFLPQPIAPQQEVNQRTASFDAVQQRELMLDWLAADAVAKAQSTGFAEREEDVATEPDDEFQAWATYMDTLRAANPLADANIDAEELHELEASRYELATLHELADFWTAEHPIPNTSPQLPETRNEVSSPLAADATQLAVGLRVMSLPYFTTLYSRLQGELSLFHVCLVGQCFFGGHPPPNGMFEETSPHANNSTSAPTAAVPDAEAIATLESTMRLACERFDGYTHQLVPAIAALPAKRQKEVLWMSWRLQRLREVVGSVAKHVASAGSTANHNAPETRLLRDLGIHTTDISETSGNSPAVRATRLEYRALGVEAALKAAIKQRLGLHRM